MVLPASVMVVDTEISEDHISLWLDKYTETNKTYKYTSHVTRKPVFGVCNRLHIQIKPAC